MARSATTDPLDRYRFLVYFKSQDFGEAKSGFTKVTSPRLDFQTEQYEEGGRHLNRHSLTQGTTFSPVTFQRGKTYSDDLVKWVKAVYRAFYNQGGNSTNYRADVVIDHLDRRGRVIKKYVLRNARPLTYIAASNFDAMDDSEVSIETLILEYEGLEEYSANYSQLGAILGSAATSLINKAFGGTDGTLKPGFGGT
jgi:phage tail-like protein